MYPLRAEGTPLRVRFASAGGTVIGAIYVDALECSAEGVGFFLGTRRIALLNRELLCFDEGRTVDRSLLDRHRPFWFESPGPDR